MKSEFIKLTETVLLSCFISGLSMTALATETDFRDNSAGGVLFVPSVTEGDVTVTGSGNVGVSPQGLGIDGVDTPLDISPGETMLFSFAYSVSDVVLINVSPTDMGGDGASLNMTLEGFDLNNSSIGMATISPGLFQAIDVTGTLGALELSSFSITMNNDAIRIGGISFNQVAGTIDLSPWKNAAGPNTGLTSDITLSASPLQDLVPAQADVSVCNYGDETVTSTLGSPIEVKLFSAQANLTTDADANDDTKALADGVSLAPGACATVSFTWTPNAAQGVTDISALTNPRYFIIDSNPANDLTTRAVTFDQQPPTVPEYSCEGFYQPFDDNITIKKKSKGTIPVKMELKDEYGYPMTDADISAPPVINVTFNSTVYGNGTTDDAALESVGSSNDGNQFSYSADTGQWKYRLGTKQFNSSGTYHVTVTSGDSNEYTINSGVHCSQSFTRQE